MGDLKGKNSGDQLESQNSLLSNEFSRYPHIKYLLMHYAEQEHRKDIIHSIKNGVTNQSDAKNLSRFVWLIAKLINDDEENVIEVLGSTDNTEMPPDLNYEISTYLKTIGYYTAWQSVSDQEAQ